MKRKRLRYLDDLREHVQGPNLEPLLDNPDTASKKGDFDDDVLKKIPEDMAVPLGRREGFHLSDTEKYLLSVIQEAFDNGVLNILSQMQRACFMDVIISGDTYDEVSERYHITRGSVQTHIHRAAARIRKVIGQFDE